MYKTVLRSEYTRVLVVAVATLGCKFDTSTPSQTGFGAVESTKRVEVQGCVRRSEDEGKESRVVNERGSESKRQRRLFCGGGLSSRKLEPRLAMRKTLNIIRIKSKGVTISG